MAVETNARIEFSVSSVEEWERVNPKLHQGEPVFAKKPSGKYILKVGAPGGSTYKNAVVVWDQDDAETKMTSTQEAAAQALAAKNAASASASAAKTSETAAAVSKSSAATSAENAKTSATNAAASKTAAANSASIASSNATSSANSAREAATSESNALKSASAANTSESNALKSASAANTSAGNAKSSETNASASASAAAQSASAAAHSAIDAAKFDPSSYYTKTETYTRAEVDNKISNIDLSQYATTTYVRAAISSARATIEANIPTKTSQLTNDSGFADASTLEAEAQKWKDAYNNLRKQSTPAVFDDAELTLLMNTPMASGNITLLHPYTDFDGLLVEYTNDDTDAFQRQYISSEEIQYRITRAIGLRGARATIALVSSQQFWYIWVHPSKGFTSTTFPGWNDNGRIMRIYGVKFKEIT